MGKPVATEPSLSTTSNLFCIKVDEPNMIPTIWPKNTIVIDPDADVQDNSIVFCERDNQIYRVAGAELRSDNPSMAEVRRKMPKDGVYRVTRIIQHV